MDGDSESSGSSRDTLHIIRMVLVAAIIVAIVIVALDNRDDVRVGYAVGHANAPIWIVIVAAAAAGAVIGWLSRHRSHQH